MTNPLDNTDLASLILADWHEEFGDIDYANEIREGILHPSINNWHWSDNIAFHGVGVGGDGGCGGVGMSNNFAGVDSDVGFSGFGVGGVGGDGKK